ncbi:MAG: DUF1365 domain-containing protein [Dehalococcoidia bacterium]|nr:DUF1365 domain-containing protein [Dehalococcoidia bacterium]
MRSEGTRSHLLVGSVGHRRLRVRDYAFTHRVWYVAVDIDELEELARRSRLLGVDGFGVMQLLTRDHIGGEECGCDAPGSGGLAAAVRVHLEGVDAESASWRVTLIAYPRVLGYVFNPVSFYLCHRPLPGGGEELAHVIAEVHNTHGECEVYDFRPEDPGARVFTSHATKRFYVSPFIGPGAEYRLRVVEDGDQLAISLFESEDGEPSLDAGVRLRRLPMSDANLARLALSDPAMGLKTIALIGWHAAKLWLRGVPWDRFRPRAEYGRRVK